MAVCDAPGGALDLCAVGASVAVGRTRSGREDDSEQLLRVGDRGAPNLPLRRRVLGFGALANQFAAVRFFAGLGIHLDAPMYLERHPDGGSLRHVNSIS